MSGWIVSSMAMLVGAYSVNELRIGIEPSPPGVFEQAVLYTGVGLNIAVAQGLHPDSHNGGAHKMGWLHAASDIAGSLINASGMFLASRGVPHAEQIAATMSSGVYVAMNYPTKSRIEKSL